MLGAEMPPLPGLIPSSLPPPSSRCDPSLGLAQLWGGCSTAGLNPKSCSLGRAWALLPKYFPPPPPMAMSSSAPGNSAGILLVAPGCPCGWWPPGELERGRGGGRRRAWRRHRALPTSFNVPQQHLAGGSYGWGDAG